MGLSQAQSTQKRGRSKKELSLSSPTEIKMDPSPPSVVEDKVKVHFVAVGSAPLMKRTKFKLNANESFSVISVFLSKMLFKSSSPSSSNNNNNNNTVGKSPPKKIPPLFLYCNSAFVPSPEERLGDLRDCFSVRDELVIHYSLQEAWG